MSQPDAEPKKGIIHCRAVALTPVMSKRCARCVVLRLEKENELKGWKQLYAGGVDALRLEKSWKLWKHPGNPGHPGNMFHAFSCFFFPFFSPFFCLFVLCVLWFFLFFFFLFCCFSFFFSFLAARSVLNFRYHLPAFPSDDHAATADALGVASRQEQRRLARQ